MAQRYSTVEIKIDKYDVKSDTATAYSLMQAAIEKLSNEVVLIHIVSIKPVYNQRETELTLSVRYKSVL